MSFLKTGVLAIGGAYSFLPLLERELIGKYQWLTKEEFLDITGIFTTFPGAISIKFATHTGYKIAGSSQADKLYINDMLVGILPKGDNSAFTKKPISFDVTSFLILGENRLLISLEEWPGDEVTPLDDIEIFDLRIELYP